MLYLALPYSATKGTPPEIARSIMQHRFELAEYATARLARSGEIVYCPIVHWHEVARKYQLPPGFEFWKKLNFQMIDRSDKFCILALIGWQESIGVHSEWQHAVEKKIPIFSTDYYGNMVESHEIIPGTFVF